MTLYIGIDAHVIISKILYWSTWMEEERASKEKGKGQTTAFPKIAQSY